MIDSNISKKINNILESDYSNKQKIVLINIINALGMVEGINYYKLISPNKIYFNVDMTKEEVAFWEKVYFYGLGEYRYLNNLELENIHKFTRIEVANIKEDLCISDNNKNYNSEIKAHISNIVSNIEKENIKNNINSEFSAKKIIMEDIFSIFYNIYTSFNDEKNEKVIVPIGAGKDSLATLNVLKKLGYLEKFEILPFFLGLREERLEQVEYFNISQENILIANRIFDKKMIEANSCGYYNGHVPFSAILAFITNVIAFLTDTKLILLSNENSASEGNLSNSDIYINHQYSKSIMFELDYIAYSLKYLSPDIYYCSYLRSISELQIAKIVSNDEELIKLMKSCNEGSKSKPWIWCGECAKCLFVYIIFYSLIGEKITNIFEKKLLDSNDENIYNIFLELIDRSNNKPFDCVGTYNEVKFALINIIQEYEKKNVDIKEYPYLLKIYKEKYYEEDKNILEMLNFKPFGIISELNLTPYYLKLKFNNLIME